MAIHIDIMEKCILSRSSRRFAESMKKVGAMGGMLYQRRIRYISYTTALGIAYMQFGPNHMWPYMINTVRNLKKSVGNGKGGGSSNNNGGGDKTSGALMEMPERIRAKIFGKKTVAVPEKQ
ncbi:hypothetical protein MUCCIDRAFT_86389 [Mucor lusitanicus CBS 277.49]|uniref:Uncharacterized protein n=1 Tax=Mucor lusitanicus CBS 277.49 TaxID=747725 RepID=A0A168H2K3_MUCCL|nr:hypothetical protein MUCCIDRAFT_86389 [Mucor lusitanicus CBS 277.49]